MLSRQKKRHFRIAIFPKLIFHPRLEQEKSFSLSCPAAISHTTLLFHRPEKIFHEQLARRLLEAIEHF